MINEKDNIKILKLIPQNYFITQIKYSSLVGHIIWYLNLFKGKEMGKKFFEVMKQSPIFVASDAFDYEYLPKPMLPLNITGDDMHEQEIKDLLTDKYRKQLKKARYIKAKYYPYFFETVKNRYNINEEIIIEIIKNSKNSIGHNARLMHNSINRQTSQVKKGALWEVEAKTSKNLWIIFKILDTDLWEYFNLDAIILDLFSNFGYGKKKSIGYGYFNAKWENNDKLEECFNDVTISFNVHKNHIFVALTDFIPNKKHKNMSYNLTTKYSKYSVHTQQQAENGAVLYFKKPTIQLTAGTSGVAIENSEFLGQAVDNSIISNDKLKSFEFAYGLPITIEQK